MMKRLAPALIAAISVVAGTAFSMAARTTRADTVTLVLPGSPIGDPVYVTPVGGSQVATNLGPYTYQLSSPSSVYVANLLGMNPNQLNDPNNKVTKAGFCIALTTDIIEGQTYPGFGVQSISSLPSGVLTAAQTTNVLKLLYDYSLPTTTHVGALWGGGGDPTNPFASPETANDALGSAIWEVINGKGTDSPVPFQVNQTTNDILVKARSTTPQTTIDNAVALANSWLSVLGTQSSQEDPNSVFALVKQGVQSQAIVIQVSNNNQEPPVPEPGSLVGLAGMGLIGLVIGGVSVNRRRRERTCELRECAGGRRVPEIQRKSR
jgi:hypothetical protein